MSAQSPEIYQGPDPGRHLGPQPPALAGKGKKFSKRFSSILRNLSKPKCGPVFVDMFLLYISRISVSFQGLIFKNKAEIVGARDKNIGVLARAGRMPAIVDLNMAAVRGPGSSNQRPVFWVTWLGWTNHRGGNSNSLLPLSPGDLGSNDPSLLTTAAPCTGGFLMSVEHLNPPNCQSYSVTGTCATLSNTWWVVTATGGLLYQLVDAHNQSNIQSAQEWFVFVFIQNVFK